MQRPSSCWLPLIVAWRSHRPIPRWAFCIRGVSWGGVIDLLDDRVELVLREILETGSLGQIAADPAVPVLVAAALARAVRVGEIGGHAQDLVHQHVQGRLRAVVPLCFCKLVSPAPVHVYLTINTPPPAQRVKHPGVQRARIHETWFPGLAPTPVGLPLRGPAPNRTDPRSTARPLAGPVGPVRFVLVGREPQAAPHHGLVPADPLRGPPDAQMLLAMQILDQDLLLGRQVRILLTHECDTFLS